MVLENFVYLAPVLGICALIFAFYLIQKVSKQDAGMAASAGRIRGTEQESRCFFAQ